MPFLLIMITSLQFFAGLLLKNFEGAARGLLGGTIGIQLFNCLSFGETDFIDVKELLSVEIIAFSISNFFDVPILPSFLPLVFAAASEYLSSRK